MLGARKYWANAKPGIIADILCFGEQGGVANSILLLDEAEKTSEDIKNAPLGALYTLLERRSAATFTDQALPMIKMDASHLVFILAVNGTDTLPEPILSRVRRCDVPNLDRPGRVRVAHNVAATIAFSLGLAPPRLSDDLIDRLGTLGPRQIRQVFEDAYGRALEHHRDHLLAEDVVVPTSQKSGCTRMGF